MHMVHVALSFMGTWYLCSCSDVYVLVGGNCIARSSLSETVSLVTCHMCYARHTYPDFARGYGYANK